MTKKELDKEVEKTVAYIKRHELYDRLPENSSSLEEYKGEVNNIVQRRIAKSTKQRPNK